MLTQKALVEAFDRNVQIVRMQITGLSHGDSLIQLPFQANCLNWVVGHLVANRLNVFKLLGLPPGFDPERLARYQRESDPITTDGPGVLTLEELLSMLEQSQVFLGEWLEAIDPGALDIEVAFFGRRSQAVSAWLFFFYFHETFHTGQTEILRQASGIGDKII
jgi:hypothetical protein